MINKTNKQTAFTEKCKAITLKKRYCDEAVRVNQHNKERKSILHAETIFVYFKET